MHEQIVSAAMMGAIDAKTAEDMVGLVTAVQTRMVCKHGILDARTAVLWERESDGRAIAVGCQKCKEEVGTLPADVGDAYRCVDGTTLPWADAGIAPCLGKPARKQRRRYVTDTEIEIPMYRADTKQRRTVRRPARTLTRNFVAIPEPEKGRWTLTVKTCGLAAGRYRTLKAARLTALELEEVAGVKWETADQNTYAALPAEVQGRVWEITTARR